MTYPTTELSSDNKSDNKNDSVINEGTLVFFILFVSFT